MYFFMCKIKQQIDKNNNIISKILPFFTKIKKFYPIFLSILLFLLKRGVKNWKRIRPNIWIKQ